MDIRINLETFKHLENSNLKIDSLKLQLHKPPYNSQEIAKSTNVQTSTYGYPQIPRTSKYQT